MTEYEKAAGGTPKYSVASGETRCIEMRGLGQVIPCGIIEDSAYLAAALEVVKAELHRRSVYATTPPFSVERGEAMAAADAALDAALDRWED